MAQKVDSVEVDVIEAAGASCEIDACREADHRFHHAANHELKPIFFSPLVEPQRFADTALSDLDVDAMAQIVIDGTPQICYVKYRLVEDDGHRRTFFDFFQTLAVVFRQGLLKKLYPVVIFHEKIDKVKVCLFCEALVTVKADGECIKMVFEQAMGL